MVLVIETGDTRAKWVRKGRRNRERDGFVWGRVDIQWVIEYKHIELRRAIYIWDLPACRKLKGKEMEFPGYTM